jgi:hypothetical protein
MPTNEGHDQLAETINLGREAALALRCTRAIIEEMTTQIMENAVGAHRSGELDPTRALVAWGKIDAIWGLQETLEQRVLNGEAASRQMVDVRPA